MRSSSTGGDQPRRHVNVAFWAVIVIGYAIAFISIATNSGWQPAPWQIAVSIILGLIYLAWGVYGDDLFARYPSAWGTAVLFLVPMLAVLAVQIFLGANGTWLLSLPIVATAVQRLRPIWRWPIYIFSLVGMALPIWQATGDIAQVWGFTLTFSPAVLFVVVFTKVSINAQQAQKRAEELACELEGANRRLAAYAMQVGEMATTQERNRLAREIHDNLGHYLTVVNVQIEAARAVLAADPAKAQDALAKAQKLTREGLTAVRQSVSALRESPLDNQSLTEAILVLTAEIRQAGIVAEFEQKGERRHLPPETKLALYRVAQEALTNVRKHAHASRVDVTLDFAANHLVKFTVRDNGVGSPVTPSGGFGLIGIRERVQALGGELKMETAVGQGFVLGTAVPG